MQTEWENVIKVYCPVTDEMRASTQVQAKRQQQQLTEVILLENMEQVSS